MGFTFYILVLTATLAVLASAEQSYCGLKSCGSRRHTRCLYPTLRVSNQCGKVQSSTLTQAEIQEILQTHNKLRARVASGQETRGNPGPQPAATNLGPLQWDYELADIAQTWANQCDFNHDKCRNTERFQVGQNLAYRASTGHNGATLAQLVIDWYDEVDQFNRNGIKSYSFESATGHYTQLIWAKTTLVGCGVVRYNADGKWNKTYLVCNYGPAGNFIGEPIYNTR